MSASPCKNIAIDFLQQAAMGDIRAAYRNYVADNFRHHNPYFRGDAAALMAGMLDNAAANPDKLLEVRLALQEDELVTVFSRVRLQPGGADFALVHIFRFEGERIAELWDIGQMVPDDAVNQFGMF